MGSTEEEEGKEEKKKEREEIGEPTDISENKMLSIASIKAGNTMQ